MDLFVVLIWIVCAFIAYNQAQKKGLNAGLWAIIGLIFGVFGVIASLIARPKNASNVSGKSVSNGARGIGSSAIAGGVAGGALGASAAGLNPAQQNAMNNLQDMANQYVQDQNEEDDDSGFDAAEDLDF
jgi:hypothetical protein